MFLGVKELPEWLKMQTNTRRQRQAKRTDDRDVKEEGDSEEKALKEENGDGMGVKEEGEDVKE